MEDDLNWQRVPGLLGIPIFLCIPRCHFRSVNLIGINGILKIRRENVEPHLRHFISAVRDDPCRVDDPSWRMDDLSCRVDEPSCRVDDLTCRVDDLSCRVEDLSWRMEDLTWRMDDLSCRMEDLSWRVEDLPCPLEDLPRRSETTEYQRFGAEMRGIGTVALSASARCADEASYSAKPAQ